MKEKKSVKNLVFNKETITNLETREKKEVKGGACTYGGTGCTIQAALCCTVCGGNYNTCPPPETEGHTSCMS